MVGSFFFAFYTLISSSHDSNWLLHTCISSIFFIFSVFSFISVVIHQQYKPFPSYYAVLFFFMYKKDWFLYLANVIFGSLSCIQSILVNFLYKEDLFGFSQWIMMINSIAYYSIVYCQCSTKGTYDIGITFGYVWGVLSFILCLCCIISGSSSYVYWPVSLLTQFYILLLYTWFISLSTHLIHQSRKEN